MTERNEGEKTVPARITTEAFAALIRDTLPFAAALGIEPLAIGEGTATIRLPFRTDFLRPGGTVGGPLLMGLADVAMYAALLSVNGPEAAAAVTANLNTTFLRRPAPVPVVAEARVIRRGKRLVYGEIALFSEGDPQMIAHATASYALPAA